MSAKEKLVEVYAGTLWQAEVVKGLLDANGIPCAVIDETIGSVQSGLRPVVVIQNNIGNKHSTTLIVATITSKSKKKREMPTHIVVNVDGLAKESIIQLEQITTVDKQQILEFVGEIPIEIMEQVDKAIKISLALN